MSPSVKTKKIFTMKYPVERYLRGKGSVKKKISGVVTTNIAVTDRNVWKFWI